MENLKDILDSWGIFDEADYTPTQSFDAGAEQMYQHQSATIKALQEENESLSKENGHAFLQINILKNRVKELEAILKRAGHELENCDDDLAHEIDCLLTNKQEG